MSEVVQFVPRPNPDRPTLLETVEIRGEEFLEHAPALTSAEPFVAPDVDCA